MKVTASVARAAIMVALLGGVATLRVQTEGQSAGQAAPAGQATASARPTPGGNADAGRQAYMNKGCYACHGREGQGSPTTGPRLGPNPTPLAAFTRYVRTPRGQMPPYTEKVVTDAELADMHAFLRTRPPSASIDSLLPK